MFMLLLLIMTGNSGKNVKTCDYYINSIKILFKLLNYEEYNILIPLSLNHNQTTYFTHRTNYILF